MEEKLNGAFPVVSPEYLHQWWVFLLTAMWPCRRLVIPVNLWKMKWKHVCPLWLLFCLCFHPVPFVCVPWRIIYRRATDCCDGTTTYRWVCKEHRCTLLYLFHSLHKRFKLFIRYDVYFWSGHLQRHKYRLKQNINFIYSKEKGNQLKLDIWHMI